MFAVTSNSFRNSVRELWRTDSPSDPALPIPVAGHQGELPQHWPHLPDVHPQCNGLVLFQHDHRLAQVPQQGAQELEEDALLTHGLLGLPLDPGAHDQSYRICGRVHQQPRTLLGSNVPENVSSLAYPLFQL